MPPAPSDALRVPRRRVLVAAGLGALTGAAALVGCTSNGDGGPVPSDSGTSGSASGGASTDAALRETVAAQELALAARYSAALARYPDLGPTLAVGDRHLSYAAALGADPAVGPSPTAVARPVPARSAVVRRLRSAETQAARGRIAQCGQATDPELARVLALIGAGCAAAAAELGRA